MIWTTKDGRRVHVGKMEDEHLLNTIALLRRRNRNHVASAVFNRALRAGSYATDAPDGAAMVAEEYVSHLMHGCHDDDILAEALPIFATMLTEAHRRGLLKEE